MLKVKYVLTVLVPFVLTFVASGFGFAQGRQRDIQDPLPQGRRAGIRRRAERGSRGGWGVMQEERGGGRGRLAMKSGKGPWERGPHLTE